MWAARSWRDAGASSRQRVMLVTRVLNGGIGRAEGLC